MSQTTGGAEYVLGTAEDEFVRLGLQHALWGDSAAPLWRRAGIGPGRHVVDVGSGPGYATMDLARLVRGVPREDAPGGGVVAVDESAGFIARLGQESRGRGLENIRGVVGDVQRLQDLGLEPGSFDAAYARWVLCFVPDPAAVVRGVAHLLKAGGRFVVNDYFNYEAATAAPRRASFSRVIRAVGESWRARGGDPDIVGRLPGLLRGAGLRLTHLEPEQRLARPGDTMWSWPDSFFRNFVPRLVEGGLLTGDEARAFFADWAEMSRPDSDSFILLPTVFGLVAEKG